MFEALGELFTEGAVVAGGDTHDFAEHARKVVTVAEADFDANVSD